MNEISFDVIIIKSLTKLMAQIFLCSFTITLKFISALLFFFIQFLWHSFICFCAVAVALAAVVVGGVVSVSFS